LEVQKNGERVGVWSRILLETYATHGNENTADTEQPQMDNEGHSDITMNGRGSTGGGLRES